MLRSEFLAAVPLTLFILACGEEAPGSSAADAGAGGTSGAPASGGAGTGGSGGSGGSTAGAGGVTGGAPSVGGAGGTGGSSTAGEPSVGGTGGGAPAVGGGAGAAARPPECAGLEANVGGIARPPDFSMSDGVTHEHTLSMDRGSMQRRQLDYQTTGSDHQHQILFTDDQLMRMMAGETIVVETEGPPLNASSGHSHTVTVHPCFVP